MPLHIDYRPKDFDEFFGNQSTVQTLKSILSREDIPHAWLFEGSFGCGKTSLSYILAEKLGCPITSNDFVEINCGSHGKIETVRDIENQARFKPSSAKCRVFLLDEAQALGTGGNSERNMPQRALLKILEQAPKHVHLILCTTNSGMLLSAIRSRCTTFQVQKLDDDTMEKLIDYVLDKEEVKINDDVMDALIEASDGHPRNALKILDQVIDLEPENMVNAISGFKTLEASVYDLFWALVKRNSWKSISDMLKELEKNTNGAEDVRRYIVGLAKTMILKERSDQRDRFMDIFDVFKEPSYNNGFADIVFNCYEVIS